MSDDHGFGNAGEYQISDEIFAFYRSDGDKTVPYRKNWTEKGMFGDKIFAWKGFDHGRAGEISIDWKRNYVKWFAPHFKNHEIDDMEARSGLRLHFNDKPNSNEWFLLDKFPGGTYSSFERGYQFDVVDSTDVISIEVWRVVDD